MFNPRELEKVASSESACKWPSSKSLSRMNYRTINSLELIEAEAIQRKKLSPTIAIYQHYR